MRPRRLLRMEEILGGDRRTRIRAAVRSGVTISSGVVFRPAFGAKWADDILPTCVFFATTLIQMGRKT